MSDPTPRRPVGPSPILQDLINLGVPRLSADGSQLVAPEGNAVATRLGLLSIDADYTLTENDLNQVVRMDGTDITLTVPSNDDLPLDPGTAVTIINRNVTDATVTFGDNGLNVVDTTDLCSGFTLAQNCMATAVKDDDGTWLVAGSGITGIIYVPPVTWDEATKNPDVELSNGDLTATVVLSADYYGALSTTSHAAGKYVLYFQLYDGLGADEYTFNAGAVPPSFNMAGVISFYGIPERVFFANGAGDGTVLNPYVPIPQDGWMGIAIDFDAGKAWVGNEADGWFGDPVAGTDEGNLFTANTEMKAALQFYGGPEASVGTADFGVSPVPFAAPAGYLMWDGSVPVGP